MCCRSRVSSSPAATARLIFGWQTKDDAACCLLAEGLKDSSAVSLLEKLRLRSAIGDLIGRMKAFHEGAKTYSMTQLQQQYDLLPMRIAAHLQHKDVALHGKLCNAWEPIWRDLSQAGGFSERYR